MIAFTTRNRPHVLEYSLKKTREVYDGFIIIVDDHSSTKEANQFICKKYDCAWLYNDKRMGIPRSKERGFRSLLTFDYQYWLDDDCYVKQGWLEAIQAAQEEEPHLLHLKPWAHISKEEDHGLVTRYSGATACFMAFTSELYNEIKGFQVGYGIYGEWHGNLSEKLSGGYFAMRESTNYIHSFDLDGVPVDFNYSFGSSLPMDERKHAQVKR